MRTLAGCLAVLAAVAATTTGARALAASVAITISPTSLSWTVGDFVNQFLTPTNGPIVVTGTMVTGAGGGAAPHTATIGIVAPAKILGSNVANVIPISALTVTCSGAGNAPAPVYAGAHTVLVASSEVDCATWSVPKNTTITVNFTMDVFLDDRTFPADTYTAAGFTVIGTSV
jgi:hypothetical protein